MARKKNVVEAGTSGEKAWELLKWELDCAFACTKTILDSLDDKLDDCITNATSDLVKAILEDDPTPTKSYRLGIMIQLAFGIVANERIDLSHRQPGARGTNGVAGKCGKYLKERHVVASVDAYQNIAKNSESLIRGNFEAFDSFLKWASLPERNKQELHAILQFACKVTAATARPVKALPEIDLTRLSFAAVSELFSEMLESASSGAHEQLIVAALLHARAEQAGGDQRVDTKHLNASDQSSGSAADIQIKTGTRVDEAYEVTANDWSEKLTSAAQAIRIHDLSRLHILATVKDLKGMIEILKQRNEDISAIDLHAFISVQVAELRRQFRAMALHRLYDLLDRYQPNVDLVNQYVERLARHHLIVA